MENGFDLGGFKQVSHNVKPAGSDKPELSLAPTANKFTINAIAAEMMGLGHKDTISIIENDSDDLGTHYAITKGFGKSQARLATAAERKDIPSSLGFSWAGPWGNILVGEPNAVPMSMEALAERGVVIGRETVPAAGEQPTGKIAYSAVNKCTFTLEFLGKVQLEGMEEAQDIYGLTNPTYTEVTPRNRKAAEEADDAKADFAGEVD